MNSDRNFINIIQQNASDTDGLTKQVFKIYGKTSRDEI